MQTVFIIDIDTTIANNNHRATFLEKECVACARKLGPEHRPSCPGCGGTVHKIAQASWDKFLDPVVMLEDTPERKAQEGIAALRRFGVPIHFLTGRNEGLREVTQSWMSAHFDWSPDGPEAIKMRDSRHKNMPASRYKEVAFLELVEEQKLRDCSFFFMEDDTHVFQMYSKYGIVIRCPEGWDHWCPDFETGVEPSFKR